MCNMNSRDSKKYFKFLTKRDGGYCQMCKVSIMTNSIKEKLVKLLELKSQNDEKLLQLDAESRILRKKIYSDY